MRGDEVVNGLGIIRSYHFKLIVMVLNMLLRKKQHYI